MVERDDLLNMGLDWLLHSNFFVYLTRQEQDGILGAMDQHDYAANEIIIKRGSFVRGIDVIISGQVSVIVPSDMDGEPSMMVRLGPGHLIGERSVVLHTTTGADVRALSCVRTLHLPAAALKKFLRQFKNLRFYIENLVSIRERSPELADVLSIPALLRDLNQNGIDYLLQASRICKMRRNAQIINAGDKDEDVYLVINGTVSVCIPQDTGKGPLVATGGRGFLFGEWTVLYGQTRSADVFMEDDGELLVIPGTTFAAYMQQHPKMRRAIDKQLTPQLLPKTIKTRVVTFAGAGPVQGAATLAYGTAGVLASQDEETVLIDLKWEQTASRLGFHVKKKNIGGLWVKEVNVPPSWPFRVLVPGGADQIPAIAARLNGQVHHIVIVSSADNRCEEPFNTADTVVSVYNDPETAQTIAKRWGQLHINAFRLGNIANSDGAYGVVPNEVRIPEDRDAAERFWQDKQLDILMDQHHPLGEACCRIARIIKGRSVGVAFGGGAAWGAAHIGLIRAMAAHGMPIDYVAGSSAGAMVAGFYAAGGIKAVEEMLHRKWMITPVAASCLISSFPLQWMTAQIVGKIRVQETKIPFYPMVTDINNGNEVVITRGSVAEAVRMSCGLPGLFPAVKKGDYRFIDGGVSNNVPASVVRKAGADFVVASNVIPQRPSKTPPPSKHNLIDWFAGQTVGRANDLIRSLFLLFWQAGCDRSQYADYLIDLAPSDYHPTDFHKSDKMADNAYELAEAHMPFILDAYNASTSGLIFNGPVCHSQF
jgi:predicted acylesterase/phospholipase RssA/CRP-like cAMP-binding protein